jgi:shikimate kinase
MPAGRRIYITGFMGSGKTTAGKKLASALKWEFYDLDMLIENREKMFIRDIFTRKGEEYFRKVESDLLKNPGLSGQKNYVISVGGGTPCFFDNMDYMLSEGIVVYLRMTPGQLKKRLEKETRERPLLNNLHGNDLLKFIKEKLATREPVYNRATISVDGFSFSTEAVIAKLNELLM